MGVRANGLFACKNRSFLTSLLGSRMSILIGGERRGKRYRPMPLSLAEIDLLLKACRRGDLSVRARAIIVLGAFAGLRVNEIVSLRGTDVNVTEASIRVLFGKGENRYRTVGMMDRCLEHVSIWAEQRDRRGIGQEQSFICNLRGEPITTDAVRSLMRRLRKKTGIVKRVHPHGLRHTAASLIGPRLHIAEVMSILGHRSLSSTATYLASIGDGSVSRLQQLSF